MRPILQSIIEQCMNSGVQVIYYCKIMYFTYPMQVSNALAAIVLRAIILKNADGMQMEAALKRSDLKVLVQVRLLSKALI